MANTVTLISYANTFSDWMNATDDLIRENNTLAIGDYEKTSGTLYLKETTQNSLQANGNIVVQKQLLVQGTGSSATIQNNLTVGGQVYFTNSTLGLTHTGQANLNGLVLVQAPGIAIQVSNSAYVGGNTTIRYNTITDTVQSNTLVNTTTLTVVSNAYTDILQANSGANTRTLSVTGTSFTDILQANNTVNTSFASIVNTTHTKTLQANNNVLTGVVQSNTSVNTATLSVTGTSFTDVLQANTSANTATLSVTGTSFTDRLQANSSANTRTLSVTGTAFVDRVQANSSVNTATISVTGTSFTDVLQANTSANTTTLTVIGTAFVDRMQANSSANTRTLSVTGTTFTNVLQANSSVNTATISVTGTSFTDRLQANSGANTRTLSVTGTSFTNVLQANSTINTTNMWATTNVAANALVANTYVSAPDVYSTNVFVTGTLGGVNATLASNSAQIGTGGLSVQGNFTINGSTVYNTNQFVLSALTPNQISYFGVYRNTTNAFIRWNETAKYWDVNDVNNTDNATTYSKLLTANLISDSVSSTSTSTLASSKAANTLNDSIVSANTSMKSYVDTANTSLKSYVDTANTSLKSYVDTTYSNATNITSGTLDAARLATSGATAGTYGGASQVPVIVVDNKGRITSVANTAVAGVAGFAYTPSNSTFTIATSSGSTFNASINQVTDWTVTGNLVVNGNTTTINTTTVNVADSLIKLANNNTVGDTLDIGFIGQANTGSVTYTGLVRKAAGNYFLFKGLTNEGTGNTIPAGSVTLANTATLQANITGGIVSGLGAAIAIADGGTNNTSFTANLRLFYDGTKIATRANTSTTVTGGLAAGNTITSLTISNGEVTAYTGSTIAITSSQVSGLATSATTDTTNASNITSGTLPNARLSSVPNSALANSAVTINGQSVSLGSSLNVNASIGIASTQVSGLAASATTDTTNASNITSGTLGSGRLPTSGVTNGTYGGSTNIPVIAVDTYGRITSAANVAVSIPGSSTDFQVNSLGVGTAGSGTTGEIRATNDITAFYTSDISFKENVREIPDALSKVDCIGGKLYDWKDDYINSRGGEDGYFVRKSDFGVIAQDVEQVFPVAVRKKPDGTLAVDYEKLCALAFAAIKELKSEIDELKKK